MALKDLAGDRARLSMLAPEPDFFYKPLTVEEPFTHQPAERRELAPALDELGVDLIRGSLASVSPTEHRVTTASGDQLAYDKLVICVGGTDAPGLPRRRDVLEPPHRPAGRRAHPSRSHLASAARWSSSSRRRPTWSLPLYELALLFRNRSEALGEGGLRLRFVTPEPAALAVFGTVASAAVAELFTGRRISLETGRRAVQDADGAIHLAPQGLPRLEA